MFEWTNLLTFSLMSAYMRAMIIFSCCWIIYRILPASREREKKRKIKDFSLFNSQQPIISFVCRLIARLFGGFIWTMYCLGFNTSDLIQNKHLNCSVPPNLYPFCRRRFEDIDHLLLHCHLMWNNLLNACGFSWCSPFY